MWKQTFCYLPEGTALELRLESKWKPNHIIVTIMITIIQTISFVKWSKTKQTSKLDHLGKQEEERERENINFGIE